LRAVATSHDGEPMRKTRLGNLGQWPVLESQGGSIPTYRGGVSSPPRARPPHRACGDPATFRWSNAGQQK